MRSGPPFFAQPISSSVAQSFPQDNPLNLELNANPFSNTDARLSYTSKSGGRTLIELMDVLGRSVRKLQNGFASAGTNVIPIDSKTLAAGTYFIRVQVDGTSAMRKLIIP